ncbi:type II toxin-antitoxin system VapC family toxin [Verminephrobacter aporrectodeae subsp. tuberculatae]|uniref:Type II toxin-antitoxin system VapC family toxin n=1 Tax=Verminephrobacter aporrectodeae subsp. tuberculatae TaxID=1110392 RepID=A0ABT3KSA3_9BURK|nr:type II toxin-antitoxin system VapC family toxin [Verminephrobacter aporrectodeae]MCW5321207.1 type II toxin-antitoxin system VapC family toxin [Verminephrobacter aporrectodeae subsp. tuberculatae]MCW8166218.1 type II toxin-antitoxin system VapC family toxin [Verminephrobacter aporrectodeae subsp. tuberculatae]MCW8170202.1 type II toxin-antitoxin system VapC family toxin [Verminephrobacter aporrectodeae subsp. tuberculatae]
MNSVIVDTNVLARFLVGDDKQQNKIAKRLFETAEEIIIPTHVFCELVWVLLSVYKSRPEEVHAKICGIIKSRKVVVRNDEIGAGLQMMETGGDFADGVNTISLYTSPRA